MVDGEAARGAGFDATMTVPTFLNEGGEMGALIRSLDWSRTAIGPIEGWPQSLRTALSLCLNSPFPMLIHWGPELITFCNDGYRPLLGTTKFPGVIGQPARLWWSEILEFLEPIYARVLAGQATWYEDTHVAIDRFGFLEETYFTFSHSPIRDESGGVGGIHQGVVETTSRVIGTRRLRLLAELAGLSGTVCAVGEVWDAAARALAQYPADVSFSLFYAREPGAKSLRLVASSGLPGDRLPRASAPAADDGTGWPLEEVLAAGDARLVEDLERRVGALPGGPWPEATGQALLLPMARPGSPTPDSIWVAGISPRLRLDAAYRDFLAIAARHITAARVAAQTLEDERRRVAELAALDRAKTDFFANVSHEFRTPLTLMLGPIEDGLADRDEPLGPRQRARQQVIRRNASRLRKLVDSLLEFSRMETGRARATFHATDLAQLTMDVASVFRSMMERAGLALVVEAEPLGEPVYVDPDLWEQIVLNLLSNAFKFTLKGGVSVTLRAVDGYARLSVRDTGVGIPEAELARVFERFHRVEGAGGRSHEGTGIGLALVQEFTRMHGGRVRVESTPGQGSMFVVEVPLGRAHLSADQIGAPAVRRSTSAAGSAFVDEAGRWLPDAEADLTAMSAAAPGPAVRRPCILVVDDNADMRAYIRALLEPTCEVRLAADGEAAFAAIVASPPELVLSDVMMPRLDGFGLLRRLREEPATRAVPTILLSARAGEEARIEGLKAGADDYLVKPFSAAELRARVDNALRMARERGERERLAREHAEFEQQLIGIVSHDLRDPVAAILMATQLLLRSGTLDEKATRTVGRIGSSAEWATRLIRDLLAFTEARLGGGLRIERRDADLAQIVRAAVDDLKQIHPEREIHLLAARECQGHWDSDRIAQLVMNLVGNALKFSPPSSSVDVRVGCEGGEASIAVHNHGTPIPPQRLASIFEPFQRGERDFDHAQRGVGLGLYIVDQIARAHAGQVTATSDAALGTSFCVRLPLEPPAILLPGRPARSTS